MKKSPGPSNRPAGKAKSKSSLKIVPPPESNETPQPLPPVVVRVTVSGKRAFAKKVEGYVKKELQSLEEVTLADRDAHYWLAVICDLDKSAGYTIAYFIAGMFPGLSEEIAENSSETENEMMAEFLEDLCWVFEHRLMTGPAEGAREACREMVQALDDGFLKQFLFMRETVVDGSD